MEKKSWKQYKMISRKFWKSMKVVTISRNFWIDEFFVWLRNFGNFWLRFLIPYGICFEVIVLYRSPPYQPSTIETTIYFSSIVFLVLLLPHGVGEDHTVQLHPFGVWTLLQWPYFVAVLYGPWCWQQSNLQSRPIPTTIHHPPTERSRWGTRDH